ncbi:MAG: hypothetical protein PWR27_229 [Petroclostridium sp.]|jgi:CBS-domain-containing membrane protein|nr:hypothetical protein [Petroclostridium sp.]
MTFSKYIKNLFSIQKIKKGLNEIEEYLDVKMEEVDNTLKQTRLKKPRVKAAKGKRRVDSQWIVKTASKKMQFAIRRLSRHM